MARGGANFPKDAWQQRVRAKLLGSAASVQLKQDNHTAIAAARKVLRQNLADRYQGSHFRTNLGYFIVGALFSVLVMATSREKIDRSLSRMAVGKCLGSELMA